MRIIHSRGTVNKAEQSKYPRLPDHPPMNYGGEWAKGLYSAREGEDPAVVSAQYDKHLSEVGPDYEPSMDFYIMHMNKTVLESKHAPKARIRFTRAGKKYEFVGGRNNYAVYELEAGE